MTATAHAEVLRIDWDQYHRLIERLAVQVYESGYGFDSLLCLARGGMRVGDVFSRLFKVPLAVLAASSYRDAAGTHQGTLDIAHYITSTGGALRGKLLLVDDMVDSGNTIARVRELLQERYPEIREIRTAVIWYKSISSVAPEFFVQNLPHNPWIIQPFEAYDRLTPADLQGAAADPGAR